MNYKNASVIVELSGGLGNQMFQYSAGRSLASRLNLPLLLDLSWFHGQSKRYYALSSFNIDAATFNRYAKLPCLLRHFSARISSKLFPVICGNPVFREPHFHYCSDFQRISSPVYLRGYWQSERYFSDIRPYLLEEFALLRPMAHTCKNIRDKILDSEAICVHVRRGDYLPNICDKTIHDVCSIDYYKAGYHELVKDLKNPHCFIFSDDPDWAAYSLLFSCPVTVVAVNGRYHEYLDLILMSLCKHFLIANSSFSWWAAWLCQYSQKKVVAPSRWFLSEQIKTVDLLPKSWMTI